MRHLIYVSKLRVIDNRSKYQMIYPIHYLRCYKWFFITCTIIAKFKERFHWILGMGLNIFCTMFAEPKHTFGRIDNRLQERHFISFESTKVSKAPFPFAAKPLLFFLPLPKSNMRLEFEFQIENSIWLNRDDRNTFCDLVKSQILHCHVLSMICSKGG